MSKQSIQVKSIEDIVAAVRHNECLLPVGGRSKRCLAQHPNACELQLNQFSGIVQYEPSEFTFTARAGTTLSETIKILDERGQYLPFDPMLVNQDATLGGTIAAGMSGPGRFRFGGLRDFILGATLVLGNGDVITTGGKVVKNAAGFDVPKLMIGSLGRLAVMTEITMKVFPKPASLLTYRLPHSGPKEAIQTVCALARTTWELDAIDYRPANDHSVWLRIGGPAAANEMIAEAILGQLPAAEKMDRDTAQSFWQSVTEFTWAADAKAMVKVPISSTNGASFATELAANQINVHISSAANVAWVALQDSAQLTSFEEILLQHQLSGLIVRSDFSSDRVIYGEYQSSPINRSIKHAFDPEDRFPMNSMFTDDTHGESGMNGLT